MEEPMWKVSGKMPPNHRKAHQPDRSWFSVWQASCKCVSWVLSTKRGSTEEHRGLWLESSLLGHWWITLLIPLGLSLLFLKTGRYKGPSPRECWEWEHVSSSAPSLRNRGNLDESYKTAAKEPSLVFIRSPSLTNFKYRLLPLYLPCSLHFDFFTLFREKRSSFSYTNIFLNYSGPAVILSKVIEEQRSFVKDTEHRAGRAHRLKRGTHQRLPGIRGTFK